jgi:HPt (histidine-containing phosphotransfer) domain-containing protein
VVVRRSLAVVSLALIPSLAGAASGVQRAPSVIGASDALRSSQPAVGSAVVASLVLLFAGVSLGHLGWRRSRARRQQTDDAGALDNTPRNETVTKIFLKYAPAQVAALGQALEAGDSAQITARAHKLKGSCLAIGAPRMAELCALLESGTSDGSGLYAELCRSLVHAERELTEQLVIGAGGTSQH